MPETKKANKGLIIGVIAGAVAVVAAIIVVLIIILGGKGSFGAGTYEMTSFIEAGKEYSGDQLKTLGISSTITLNEDGTGTYKSSGNSGDLTWDKEKKTITIDGDEIELKVDGNKFTVEFDGVTQTFTKK